MTKKHSVELDKETYRRLRQYSHAHGISTAQAIGYMLNELFPAMPTPCRAHLEWTKQVVKIGREQGDEAAERWMAENPYEG